MVTASTTSDAIATPRSGSGPTSSRERTVPQQRPAPVAMELAAALLVPAATFGFTRVFAERPVIIPIMGAALLSTALAALLRRLRLPLVPSALISLVFLSALVVNRFAPGTGRLGIFPTSATRDQFQLLADDLILNFQELRTPVPSLDPFVAAAMVGAWLMAFLTDWGALRLRLAFEPVLPAGLLFVFSSVLGTGADQVLAAVVFGLAVSVWAVTQRSANMADGNAWLANDRRRGSLGLAALASVFALGAVALGAMAGPRLPGATSEEMLSLREAGDPTRQVVSPFVGIGERLVEQSDVRLFTVAAREPSYWRMAGLDNYEDFIWKVAGNFSPEDGALPDRPELGGQRDQLDQQFTIERLDAIWLPAAFAPVEINDASVQATWNAPSSSLTVANDVPSSDGVSYSVVSEVPRFSPEELRGASETIPPDIAERYLTLPAIPDLARAEAERVTAGAVTRYDKMLALQRYFREFDYSVSLSPRTGDPIEQFLQERVGFCQQFAGSFAVMARHLGVPARVAIGFTWGDPIGTDDEGRTVYAVSGRQTHAWPEVWFDGLGWVAFEPTPGRGAPASAAYTEVAAQQDSAVQQTPEAAPSTTTPPPAQGAGGAAVIEPEFPIDTGVGAAPDTGPSWGTIVRFLVVIGLIGAYAGGVPLIHRLRRQRRRQRVVTPADGVETAWAEATESLDLMYGIARRPAETRREFAQRLSSDPRVPREPMRALAEQATVARYYPHGLQPADAERASSLAGEVEQAVAARVSPYTRWKRLVDPRRVFRRSGRVTTPASPRGRQGPPPSSANGDHRALATSGRGRG